MSGPVVLTDAATGERIAGIGSVYIAAGRHPSGEGFSVENYMAHDGFPDSCPDTDALMQVLAAQLGYVLYAMQLVSASAADPMFIEQFWGWLKQAGMGYLDHQLAKGLPIVPPVPSPGVLPILDGMKEPWLVVGPRADNGGMRCAVRIEALPPDERNSLGVARMVATAMAALIINSVDASGYALETVEVDMRDLVWEMTRGELDAWLAGDSNMTRTRKEEP